MVSVYPDEGQPRTPVSCPRVPASLYIPPHHLMLPLAAQMPCREREPAHKLVWGMLLFLDLGLKPKSVKQNIVPGCQARIVQEHLES